MPYKLRKAPKRDAFWVINTETGKKHSNDPLPRDRAEAQMRALYASETTGGAMCGKGKEPPKGIPIALLQVLARASYSGRTPLRAGGFTLVRSTPTIKIYKRGDGIVVSVRGTDPLDRDDLVADFASVKGTLRETTRYKQDEAFLRKFQADFPRSRFRYTAVGHSLGGAIIDGFFRAGLIDNAFSFNPMIEPHERGGNPLHRRLYNNEDPLYLAFGKGVKGVEVRDPRDPLWLAWAKFKLPKGLRELFTLYDAHRLQKFKGGAREDAIPRIFRPNEVRRDRVRRLVDVDEEVDEPVYETQIRKVRGKVPNPVFEDLRRRGKANTRFPPPDGAKGVPQTINGLVDTEVQVQVGTKKVKTGKKVKEARMVDVDVDLNPDKVRTLTAIEENLRELAHFYEHRDPATALGFRVVADDIRVHRSATYGEPLRDPAKEAEERKNHDDAQEFSAMAVLGRSAKGYDAPYPRDRLAGEVLPYTSEAFINAELADPASPLYGAKPSYSKTGKLRYAIPPTSKKQRELLLQDYPQIKGRTMYYDVNK